MYVMGIETTCDETACSIVENGKQILSNVISSQVELHSEFGGVVPELACRKHVEWILPVIDQALDEASLSLAEIDLIAVAKGPGLIGPLLVGIHVAKALSLAIEKPFIGVNHIEAHLYAAYMSHVKAVNFPAIGVVISGGHTSIVRMDAIGEYNLLGQTVDDAIGEAFDKVAKMLGEGYPGGPCIERLAQEGDPLAYPFRGGQVKGHPLDFSFSGLKTALLYAIQRHLEQTPGQLSFQTKTNLAASFQRAAVEDLLKKVLLAAEQNHCHTLLFGGGVTNNFYLRQRFQQELPHFKQLWPAPFLTLDNGAMIAGLGYHQFLHQKKGDSFEMAPLHRMGFYPS